MFTPPAIPAWHAVHTQVVHFPIALLLVAPLLVLLGLLLRPESARGFQRAALLLMLLGTAAAFVAVASGAAAADKVDAKGPIEHVLETHEELAETARNVFAGLTAAYAALLFLPGLLKKDLSRGTGAALTVVFLAAYGAGALILVNAAHNGGRLVHEFGVRAQITSGAAPAGDAGEAGEEGEKDEGRRGRRHGGRER